MYRLTAAVAFALLFASYAEQVKGVKVQHRLGQTFITWQDVDSPELTAKSTDKDVAAARKQLAKRQIKYRVYRSSKPITSLEGLNPIGAAQPLSCWDFAYYGQKRSGKPRHSFRWVIEDGGKPLPPGTGLYVHNPKTAGNAYYAVTFVEKGKENQSISADNASQKALKETVGQGEPILQRVTKPDRFQFVRGATLNYYTRWEAPPNSSKENHPIDYVVGIPPKVKTPWVVGLHLHCWGGNLNGGYAWWDNNQKGSILLASNQQPYDWWTGYNEAYFRGKTGKAREKAFKEGVVRPYTMNRTFSFLKWLTTKHNIDLTRTFVVGNSMGGSGAVMCAVRYPKRIAFCRSWVGVHIPSKTPRFKNSYEGVYGKQEWNVKFEDGTPVWDYYNDAWFLRKYPRKEIGFITFSNGKNDGAIGWPQAVEFAKAMQETKRPHLFVWGQSGHGQRTVYPKNESQNLNPIDMRLDQSLPAFTGCSLDDNPGSGDPNDGDKAGQFNRWLYWETQNVVDTESTWEMTVVLGGKAPKSSCTVDITPRRLQKLEAKPGTTFKWTNTSGGKVIQQGTATADQHGLITLSKVQVSKAKNRIKLSRN